MGESRQGISPYHSLSWILGWNLAILFLFIFWNGQRSNSRFEQEARVKDKSNVKELRQDMDAYYCMPLPP